MNSPPVSQIPGRGDAAGIKSSSQSGNIAWLDEGRLRGACSNLKMPEAMAGEVIAAARVVTGHRELRALALSCRQSLFSARSRPDMHRWPSIEELRKVCGRHAGMFYLLVFLSELKAMTERLKRTGAERDIPPEVISDTVTDITGDMPTYFKVKGGFPPGSLAFRVFVNFGGEYFRLGRLAFHLNPFKGGVRVFRCGSSVCALAEDGLNFRFDGQLDGPGRMSECPRGWVSQLDMTPDGFCGHPVVPGGRAQRELVVLPRRKWEQVLAPGDTVLDIHIPAGAGMEHGDCGASMKRALEFFPRHFPDRKFRAFACSSWLLEARLQDILSSQSNIVKFQREFYLFPNCRDDRSLIKHVLGCDYGRTDKMPVATSAQRALAALLDRDELPPARAGGGFILPQDFDWGRRVYISRKGCRKSPSP